MKEDRSRFADPRMEYYHRVYRNSPLWKGEQGGRLVIYCEQGYGDIIQFARYFRQTGNYIILHCPKPLHRLLKPLADEIVDKSLPPPAHDYHVPSFSLPFVLGHIEAEVPYIFSEKAQVEDGFKVGIAWEGNPNKVGNRLRSCPLHHFKSLDVKLYMLQNKIHLPELAVGCEDLELLSIELNDFADTATLIAAMDAVISVDTAVLHLAGAMGKRGFGILGEAHDVRWDVYQWYPSVELVLGKWEETFQVISKSLGTPK